LWERRVAYGVGVQRKQSITATGWTVVLNAVLAVCGIALAVGNVNGPDHFMLVCGVVMALSGAVSFVLNLRTWRRARQSMR
jgi:drug/metabolite transporter (DMT)-like permease